MDRLTTPARPDLMVGAWVRLRDHDRSEHPFLGVLERAEAVPDHPGLWRWALRTPTGRMSGGPHLPAQPLTREHRADVARARRQLDRALARDRDLLARLREHGDDPGVVPRAVQQLEHMRARLTAQLSDES